MEQYDVYGNVISRPRLRLGCLLGLIIAIATIGFVVGLFFLISGAFTSSEPYQTALAAARSNETVTTIMGEPITPGLFTTGSLRSSGLSASADLQISISGPKKSGTLYVTAQRRNGQWVYFTLAVEVDGQIITLSP